MEADEMVKVFGQIHELQKQLLRGRLKADEVRRPLQDILEHKFILQPAAQPDWYVAPEEQLANVRRWNHERGWGFADMDFPTEIPNFTPSSPLEVLVLAVYLRGQDCGGQVLPYHIRTANELWEIARGLQPNWWQWDGLKLDADHLRLQPGVLHDPGIRWVALDLGAHWNARDGVRLCDVRSASSASAEILAAAAHFPQWVQAMDGKKVPYVWLAGYTATVPGGRPWAGVPYLRWDEFNHKANLDADWADNVYYHWAAPVVREL